MSIFSGAAFYPIKFRAGHRDDVRGDSGNLPGRAPTQGRVPAFLATALVAIVGNGVGRNGVPRAPQSFQNPLKRLGESSV
jgi:hypothetical protein